MTHCVPLLHCNRYYSNCTFQVCHDSGHIKATCNHLLPCLIIAINESMHANISYLCYWSIYLQIHTGCPLKNVASTTSFVINIIGLRELRRFCSVLLTYVWGLTHFLYMAFLINDIIKETFVSYNTNSITAHDSFVNVMLVYFLKHAEQLWYER